MTKRMAWETSEALVDEGVSGRGVSPGHRSFDAGFVAAGISGEPLEKFVLATKLVEGFKAVPDVGVPCRGGNGAPLPTSADEDRDVTDWGGS